MAGRRTSELSLGHLDGQRDELREDSHGVGDVDDLEVLDDLGDEVARVEKVSHDRHAHAQRQHVRERLQQVLRHRLAVRVVGAGEVGLVTLLEALQATLARKQSDTCQRSWPEIVVL